MDTYQPIRRVAPGMEDTVISVKSKQLESAPPLSFLKAEYELITASSAYYDPFNPQQSASVPVNYSISRVYNVLAADPLLLRHNGNTVDMEIYVDSYNFIQQEPIVDFFSFEPKLRPISEEDFYLRSTTAYIYKDIPVPRASNRVWDGRYLRCVDRLGNDVDPSSKLIECRADVNNRINFANSPYLVQPIGSKSRTVIPPQSDLYAVNYQFELEDFIVTNYNSFGIPARPRRRANLDILQEVKAGLGTGRFFFSEGFIAAVLDGYYFIDWANVYRYKEEEIEPDNSNLCGHIIESYDKDNDAVILLGDMCGAEPTAIEDTDIVPGVTAATIISNDSFTYVVPVTNSTSYSFQLPAAPALSNLWLVIDGLPSSVTAYVNNTSYADGGLIYSNVESIVNITLGSNDILEPMLLEITTIYFTI